MPTIFSPKNLLLGSKTMSQVQQSTHTQGLENLSSSPPSLAPQPHPMTAASSKPWSSLHELLLSHNPLGPDSGPSLSSLLSLTPDLRGLHLQSCGLEGRTLERHTGLGHTLRGGWGDWLLSERGLIYTLFSNCSVSHTRLESCTMKAIGRISYIT